MPEKRKSLKNLALQIAPQLPADRQEALRVLAYVKELIEWEMAADAASDSVEPTLPNVVRLIS